MPETPTTSKTSEFPAKVSVVSLYDHNQNSVTPKKLVWHQTVYDVDQLGLHYTFKKGLTLFHVFCVASKTLNFKLILDTSDLSWLLEEVYDEVLN